MASTKIEIQQGDAAKAAALLAAAQGATAVDPPLLELGPCDPYHLSYASYPMASSTPWTSQLSQAPKLPYGSPPAGVPALRVWQLPGDLVNLPHQPTAASPAPPLPCFDVGIARVQESSGATQSAPAPYYGWATQIGVTVKKLETGATTPAAAMTYELIGADEHEVVLLERILTAAGLKMPGFGIERMTLLHSATGGPAGLTDDGDGVMSFIAQSNLSTVTNPPQQARMLRGAVAEGLQEPVDFVRLLWECSITRSGGFYLYYCSDPKEHKGLPDAIFNDKGEAALTMLLLHEAPAEAARRNRVAGYMNALVTGGYIDVSSSTVFAQTRPLPGFADPAEGGDPVLQGSRETLAELAAAYYMDPVQLVEDNAEAALASGGQIAVEGGLYEVPATDGAGALSKIASRFNVSPAQIEAANPGLSWSSPQPALTLVHLPALTVSVGTSPDSASFAQISGYYGVRLAQLALDSADKPGLFSAALQVRGGPLARHAASPPGVITYGLTRTAAPPPADAEPKSALERLYSLLSYRVPAGLEDFEASRPGPPLGPLTAPPSEAGDKLSGPQDDGVWRYQKAVPYAKLAKPPERSGEGPDPARSPYLGVGGLLRLELAWNDLFGNRGLTPLTQPSLEPAAPLNLPPARALYTDPVVGISEWPSIGLDYEVLTAGAGQAKLQIALGFDHCAYLTGGELGCPASAEPDKGDPVEKAKKDLAIYERIWHQLAPEAGSGLAVSVETSLLKGEPQALDPAPLRTFAAAIYEWLKTRSEGTVKDPAPAMPPIVVPLDLAKVAAAHPQQIFELGVRLTMSRPLDLVDPDLQVEGKVAVNSSTVPPHHARKSETDPYTLDRFTENFEAAMQLPGAWKMKLAAGVDREEADRAGTGAPLWAVRLGTAAKQPPPLAVSNPGTATTCAPRPIATAPRTGEAQIKEYVSGKGLGAVKKTMFTAVDLDGWVQQMLLALDTLLSPTYATAIGLLDSHLPGREPHLQALAEAKEALASALGGLVIPVLPGAEAPDLEAARELFAQQLLIELGSFYTTDAIVQLPVEVASGYTEKDTAPRLFGNLTQPKGKQETVKLTNPKIPLAPATGNVPPTLTFLLSTAAGHADIAAEGKEISLDLTFEGTNVEQQIGSLPGIVGYQASSWLSFLKPETSGPLQLPLGTVKVPLVLRGFPAPPTMREQTGAQSVPDKTQGLKLGQTLAWDYKLSYSAPFHYQQDTLHLTLEFNHPPAALAALKKGNRPAAADPFAPLAQFISSYPAVREDIDTCVAPIDPGKIDPTSQQFKDGDVALTTFTEMIASVAAALKQGQALAEAEPESLPVEEFELTIGEATVELESLKDPGEKVRAALVTVGDVPPELAVPVEVEIPGCEARTPPAGGAAGAGDGSYSYVYVDRATGDWLPSQKDSAPRWAETIPERVVKLPGLNVLARQDAWASAWIGRNEKAAEQFRYQTPTVRFPSALFPTNTYTEPTIKVEEIGSGSAQKRTPEQHLQALFGALFAKAPEGEQTIQLECRYEYALSGEGLLPIDLPVYLLAPTTFEPKEAMTIPAGGCPADRTQGPLVCRLGGAIRTWWEASRPSEEEGAFLFSLTVMSQLTGQPLIVLDDLQLDAGYVAWT